MYRCSLELSVQYDGQSESEQAYLIDEPFVYYMANRFDLCFEHYI